MGYSLGAASTLDGQCLGGPSQNLIDLSAKEVMKASKGNPGACLQKFVKTLKFHDDHSNPEKISLDELNQDLSALFLQQRPTPGYIGDEYDRLIIHLVSVKKLPNSMSTYRVEGMSSVAGNRLSFSGELILESSYKFKEMHFGYDNLRAKDGIKMQGFSEGVFKFNEDSNQKSSGIFSGRFYVLWYIDRFGNILYDQINDISDSFRNFQFAGTWVPYSSSKSKPVGWGHFRIPFSGDLDIGAGEFSVSKKYRDNGWTGRFDGFIN